MPSPYLESVRLSYGHRSVLHSQVRGQLHRFGALTHTWPNPVYHREVASHLSLSQKRKKSNS